MWSPLRGPFHTTITLSSNSWIFAPPKSGSPCSTAVFCLIESSPRKVEFMTDFTTSVAHRMQLQMHQKWPPFLFIYVPMMITLISGFQGMNEGSDSTKKTFRDTSCDMTMHTIHSIFCSDYDPVVKWPKPYGLTKSISSAQILLVYRGVVNFFAGCPHQEIQC